MKFIDLFCGLGGFHLALKQLGHKCVFASEIERHLIENYKKNFNFKPAGDIKKVNLYKIPDHDILCAGFPCQPFSKAGTQSGFDHKIAGGMFEYILKILKIKKPQYLILENVPNLKLHRQGKTWELMKKKIENIGYDIESKIMSPLDVGIPQSRERFFIVGQLKKIINFKWPKKQKKIKNLQDYIEKKPSNPRNLTKEKIKILKLWNSIIKTFPKNQKIFNPIWTTEFGANYPLNKNLKKMSSSELGKYNGKFGASLKNKSKEDQLNLLPSYSKRNDGFPIWKQNIINKNRKFYQKNKKWCNTVLAKIKKLQFEAYFKLEWNCMGEKLKLDDKLISFRPSGIRIKRSFYSPTLVASTIGQVAIIYKSMRYLSFKECLFLQGFPKNFKIPKTFEKFYWAIGNAVNVKVVKEIAKNLIN